MTPTAGKHPTDKRFATVNGKRMAYVEVGEGDPIVFLHGNPTSSYLWRNVIPHVADLGRCIAPDLIGQGDSEKLDDSGPGSYRFVEHRTYLWELLEQIGVTGRVTLVVHDWGSALGFDWAANHPEAVAGICYMEAIVRPIATWDEWPEAAQGIFQAFRSPAGEDMVLEKNLFVEAVLPGAMICDLSPEDHDEYRRPFAEPGEGRRPTLTWPREIPIEFHSQKNFKEDLDESTFKRKLKKRVKKKIKIQSYFARYKMKLEAYLNQGVHPDFRPEF